MLSRALIRLRKAGPAQLDENCGTKSSNPFPSAERVRKPSVPAAHSSQSGVIKGNLPVDAEADEVKHFLADVDADDQRRRHVGPGLHAISATRMNTTDASASSIAGSKGARSFSTSIQSPAWRAGRGC